ncbi:TetR/AcrR family transcriptional regulator [Mycobacterium sp. NPDC003323]
MRVVPELPETHSATAARILAAADELLQRRGSRAVTVADVAQKAHVGKGTVYLYWTSKADLLLGLIGRDFLDLAGQFITDLHDDPDLARPSRLFPALMQRAAHRPFVRAMLRNDDDLLGALTDDPRSAALVEALGPDALLNTLLPSWRHNALARTDWDTDDQVHALMALYRGFLLLDAERGPSAVDTADVLGRSTTALLGPERPTRTQMRQVAADGIAFLERGRSVVLQIISK